MIAPAAKRLELPLENLIRPTTPLGIGLDADVCNAKKLLVPGDMLIGLNRGLIESRDAQGRAFDLQQVLDIRSSSMLMNVDEVLTLLQKNLREQGFMAAERDFAVMLVQCRSR